jgi:DNA polymerase/3'-5' exonuclease PolX
MNRISQLKEVLPDAISLILKTLQLLKKELAGNLNEYTPWIKANTGTRRRANMTIFDIIMICNTLHNFHT